jgi:hypothetical protein
MHRRPAAGTLPVHARTAEQVTGTAPMRRPATAAPVLRPVTQGTQISLAGAVRPLPALPGQRQPSASASTRTPAPEWCDGCPTRGLHRRGPLHRGMLAPRAARLVRALVRHLVETRDPLPARLEIVETVAGVARQAADPLPGTPPATVAACREAFGAAVPGLVSLLADPAPRLRGAVLGVLGELGWCADAVVPPVLSRYADEDVAGVRLAQVLAVGRLVGQVTGAPVRTAAARWLRLRRASGEPAERAMALASSWRPVVVAGPVLVLAPSPGADLVAERGDGLGSRGDGGPALRGGHGGDDFGARRHGRDGLGLRDDGGDGDEGGDEAVAERLAALLDAVSELTGPPAPEIADVTGPRWGDWLAGSLGDDRDARVALAERLFDAPAGAGTGALRVAAEAISTWRSARDPLLERVRERLTAPDPDVRAAAAQLLAALAGALAEPHPALSSDGFGKTALLPLYTPREGPQRSDGGLADAFVAALSDPSALVADLAAWGLSRLGDPRCLSRLRGRALMGTSFFDIALGADPRGVYRFGTPGLSEVLAPLGHWAAELLPRVSSALSDSDTFHQQRVFVDVLAHWGAAATPAVAALSELLDDPSVGLVEHVCAALGSIGPGAAGTRAHLLRLVERGGTARLRATAAWAYWRTGGDPELALRVLSEALAGELGPLVLPRLADLGPLAVGQVDRVRALAAVPSNWYRTEAARALHTLTGDPSEAVPLLRAVLDPLTYGETSPVTARAVAVVRELGPVAVAAVEPVLRGVLDSDRRFAFYGDWRAITDDEALRVACTAALA